MRRRTSRVYWRVRNGTRRGLYGDFRDFADVGGSQEPLVAEGESVATTDPDVAEVIAAARLQQLEGLRRDRSLLGTNRVRVKGIEEYADEHLAEKQEAGAATARWLRNSETHLQRAVEFFRAIAEGGTWKALPEGSRPDARATVRQRDAGFEVFVPVRLETLHASKAQQKRLRDLFNEHGDIPVGAIGQDEVRAWMKHLKTLPGRRPGTIMSPGVQRQHLNTLSSLMGAAVDAKLAVENPVQKIKYKPVADVTDPDWFEVPDAALILEACRVWEPEQPGAHAIPYLYELIATYLFCGVRRTEGFGMEVEDLQFRMNRVRVRENDFRSVKAERARRRRGGTAERFIPMPPQYRQIMEAYLSGPRRPRGKLLFPSPRFDTDHMLNNIDKALDGVAKLLGMGKGSIRLHALRHTYCTARLQTVVAIRTPQGVGYMEVPRDTVARELGHGGEKLVARLYGHQPLYPCRTEAVEYRLDDWRGELGERIHSVRPRLIAV